MTLFSFVLLSFVMGGGLVIMFLKSRQTGSLVEVMNLEDLINPSKSAITVRAQAGEEEQDPEELSKDDLTFPSNESLPICWLKPDYQSNAASLG
jgi:hypothetical protein